MGNRKKFKCFGNWLLFHQFYPRETENNNQVIAVSKSPPKNFLMGLGKKVTLNSRKRADNYLIGKNCIYKIMHPNWIAWLGILC